MLARLAPWGLALAGLLVCLSYLAAEMARLKGGLGFPLDDSWIHLQFARNLARGQGFSINPGQVVTGSTAPLWTVLLSLLFFLPGSVMVWTKALGIAIHLAGVEATRRLAREVGLSDGLAVLAAVLTLATRWLVWASLSGMETPLFVVLSLAGIIRHIRERAEPRRRPFSVAILAVAVSVRPEGILLLVLAFVDRLLVFDRNADGSWRWRASDVRPLLVGATVASAALAGLAVFYLWVGGSVLPTTWAAKGGDLGHHVVPDPRYLLNVLAVLFLAQPWKTGLAVGGAASLVVRLGTPRDRGLLLPLWLFALPLVYAMLTPAPNLMLGQFGRYYFPLFPIVIVVGLVGLERAGRFLARLATPAARIAAAALVAGLILAPTVVGVWRGRTFYVQNVANVEESDVAIARWLAARVHPEAVLAVSDIGAIKYLLPNRIIDLAGIASPETRQEVTRAAAAGVPWDDAMVAAIERARPDYVVAFPDWVPRVAGDPRFRAVHRLEIPDNVTMGGNEIVVYEAPWTRYRLLPRE